MFGWCGSFGLTGWVMMAVLWTGLVALVVWAIARLFPERPAPPPPPPVAPTRVDSVDRL